MSPIETYKIFNSVKLHFTVLKYDYFKYSGKSKFNDFSYKKCKGKFYFEKIGAAYLTKTDVVNFFVSNMIVNTSRSFIGDFLDDECDEVYQDWQKRTQSLYKFYCEDCHVIKQYCNEFDVSYKDVFFEDNGKLPVIFALIRNKNISMESVVVMNRITGFVNKKNYINPLSIKSKLKLTKYEKFIIIDNLEKYAEKFKSIIIE